ncbi:acetyltransferase, N-acetylglutamate synthase [Bernardetia litoralis DSM 6794]|uniref:Acetyltransferase, N-acetylglutamate synthase n=1 Tax=Bernardetia litoralis (strain ATCC 23117 / DSM 6794 / NBRC 15988 / NCIMB 1366 / Fx l1 / Sio-4) TaxID=880071 RepID=I4AQY5_BERLS|nr:GNAT family N-acetyltransferase [Bernardetia litoralis]AFM06370.1 acetyltransferase, N-acetylglutamate synthase [Bernardetia litoralis DSM 6794]
MVSIVIADEKHQQYAAPLCQMIEEAAKSRGTGIAKRDPLYIQQKMLEGKAVIALEDNDNPETDKKIVGFCYIETWQNQEYVVNSGLIVHPDYRKTGLAKSIKKAVFELSKKKFPNSKLFGITTSLAVMKINSDLGYKPVTFSELTQDDAFWKGCQGCVNYDVLQRNDRKICLCTGMMCDLKIHTPSLQSEDKQKKWGNFVRFLKLRSIRLQRKINIFPRFKDVIYKENKQENQSK